MNSVFAIYKIKSCKKNIDYYCIIVYNSKNLFLPKEAILSKSLDVNGFHAREYKVNKNIAETQKCETINRMKLEQDSRFMAKFSKNSKAVFWAADTSAAICLKIHIFSLDCADS